MRRAAAALLARGCRSNLVGGLPLAGEGAGATMTMDSTSIAPISLAAALMQARAASNAAASSSSSSAAGASSSASATASVTVPSYDHRLLNLLNKYKTEIETFHARLRTGTGSLDASKLRKSGRVPATVVGLPGGKNLTLSLPKSEVDAALRAHGGRRGLAARVFDVRVKARPEHAAEAAGFASTGELLSSAVSASSSSSSSSFFTMRVLTRQVHRGMVSGEVENVNFLLLPCSDKKASSSSSSSSSSPSTPDKRPTKSISVRVPIVVLGAATAPGVKRGGFLNLIRRDVKLRCEMRDGGEGGEEGEDSPSSSSSSSSSSFVVPRSIEVDASHLELGERVALRSLSLPEGVFLDEEHLDLPVLKVAGRQARD